MLCVMTDKERIWAERVGEWKASGKTLQEFAKDQPYKGLTLRWWSSELRRRGLSDKASGRQRRPRTPAKPPSVRMVRVVPRRGPEPAQPAVGSIAVEIGGARIVVQQGFDAGVLSNVVRALKEAR